MTNNINEFTKSDIGAKSAWKGFSSQTLYIASRIASDTDEYEFFPEDVEDLVVKKDGTVGHYSLPDAEKSETLEIFPTGLFGQFLLWEFEMNSLIFTHLMLQLV